MLRQNRTKRKYPNVFNAFFLLFIFLFCLILLGGGLSFVSIIIVRGRLFSYKSQPRSIEVLRKTSKNRAQYSADYISTLCFTVISIYMDIHTHNEAEKALQKCRFQMLAKIRKN